MSWWPLLRRHFCDDFGLKILSSQAGEAPPACLSSAMLLDRHAPVLVTGSAGRIGRAAVAALSAAGWRVRGFDCVPTPGIADFMVGNLTDFSAVRQAAQGAGAVIHLGATPDDDDFMTRLLPNNLIGLHHVLEAAREADVKRIFLASTGQVNWWQQFDGPWPNRPDDPVTPRHWYAVTKVAAEAAGKAYAKSFGMTVLALRLGWCPRTAEQAAELDSLPRGHDTYLSPGDAGRFFVRALTADLPPGFWTLFVASRPVHQVIFDLEPTKQLLGWEPQDQWPHGLETFS
ncbi:MAG: NAD(P)-dependent oxidoreductase [Verrucomicrobia bacterium]|nr:NAD(P)-dependent oxidoreductase [Verrucomicrobiota bacterium]